MLLITQPRVGTAHNEIIALQMAARELGWDVLPAPGGWRLDEETIKSGAAGVPYGSQIFCEVISQQMNWKLKANSFDWLTKVPKKYLKRKVEFMTLGEAKKIVERKFIKPADDKCFDAKIYEPGEFKPHEILSDNTPVLVSDIVEFTHEYRCFVRDNRCVTWSSYIYDGEIANPKNWQRSVPGKTRPQWFMELLLSKMKSEDAVVDIGQAKGTDWAVIESNPAWASGLYGCDPTEALLTMSQAVTS